MALLLHLCNSYIENLFRLVLISAVMNLLRKIESFCHYYDRYGNEITDRAINDEYWFFLKLSLHYPSLKLPFPFIAHFLHMIFVFIIIILHIYFVIITVIVSKPEDHTSMIHTLHFGVIIFLYSLLLIPFNLSRYAVCLSYKMIGNGVYIYEGEHVSLDENEMINRYKAIMRKVKIAFPAVYIVTGSCKLIIAPCIDYILGTKDPRTYTSGGINLDVLLPMWYPLESSHEGLTYFICLFGQMVYIYDGVLSLSLAMCCYFVSLLHVAIQLERLIMSIKNLEKRAMNLYRKRWPNNEPINDIFTDKLFLDCVEHCFKENIKHSLEIFRLHKYVNTYSRNVLFFLFLGECLFVAVSATVLKSAVGKPGILFGTTCILFAEFFEIITLCKMGQKIIDLNQELRFTVYDMKWYKYSKRVKPYMIMIQGCTSRDLRVRAMFNVVANMETCGTIFNTAYTYYNLLFQTKKLS